jgi:DNA-binding protein Fis
MSEQSTKNPVADVAVTALGDDFSALDGVDFLDDIDFTLEDVESTIAPLALAHI